MRSNIAINSGGGWRCEQCYVFKRRVELGWFATGVNKWRQCINVFLQREMIHRTFLHFDWGDWQILVMLRRCTIFVQEDGDQLRIGNEVNFQPLYLVSLDSLLLSTMWFRAHNRVSDFYSTMLVVRLWIVAFSISVFQVFHNVLQVLRFNLVCFFDSRQLRDFFFFVTEMENISAIQAISFKMMSCSAIILFKDVTYCLIVVVR